MLELQNISRRFGATQAVSGVSLKVPAGQMVGVIGRSGAGKSTLLRMINRLTEPSEGRILHDGVDVTALRGQSLRDWRTRCGMIFQQFNLVQRLDVLTNVLVGRLNHRPGPLGTLASLFKSFPAEERAMALMALDRFDLADQALQRADTLSGGQQQRVAIARALMQEPRIILADEPIASLDPRNARTVMDALRDVNRRDGITVLCNLHHLDTAREYCTRVIAMQGGRMMFDGPPEGLTAARLREIYGVSEAEFNEQSAMAHAPRAAAEASAA
ncbi:phosphonate ABC transporter ATP-binding protein [Pseudoroseomonas rhizosphaerae]|uniref:Phosphonate ABC transporter ATP-binding protein n=1 Tax=Teichococcus rhizosphaerae TaxID=1335062 RepID=A0A2C6Z3Z6_9PROT|nr:phosphonate ABC transporter ATP-binding protein [Pseudoroseomonas rhizosphaerae]PHK93241.1 phosphonate ABC transporter ATP-binding protein [Pseudoroseomonas rhizosphaerae]